MPNALPQSPITTSFNVYFTALYEKYDNTGQM